MTGIIRNCIPSLCTLINLGAGAVSLMFTVQEQYRMALSLIAVAAFFDVLDGLLARLLHCTSEFGKQLDSLADLISFGAAPVYLIFFYKLSDMQGLGAAAAILFLACGALRLARFNLMPPSKKFTGLPITAAGILLSCLSLLNEQVKPHLFIILIGVLSLLMVSRIPFPSLKKIAVRK
ncbi:CDP-alcohol phosphatidyltransferase [compost metagenome]